ncbi:hypothetical protein RDABS01_039180 [Bienertia sinuspersici]
MSKQKETSNSIFSSDDTTIIGNGKPNQIHSSPKDFACDNTYEDMQQTIRNAQNMGRQTYEQQTSGDFGNNRSDKPKSMKSRLPFLVNGWPTDVVYDAKEEVATIGLLWAGWGCWCGQVALPLSRGTVGRSVTCYCCCGLAGAAVRPVSVAARISCAYSVVEHFIIPNDEVYDKLALQRVDKYWRHYKHELKKTFFHPDKKTKEQHYDPVPSGHTSNDWIKLVNHWFSPKGQKLSQMGKEARSLQCQTHIMGSNSYANMRADYEAEHGKPMGLIEAWERSHVRKDGSFVEGTATEDFLVCSTWFATH